MKNLLLTGALIACFVQSQATDYYVATTGNNANAGTAIGTPFKTITYALSVAGTGNTINVAAGTYNMALGEVFPLTIDNAVTITGTNGAINTIIDAAGSNQRVILSQPASGVVILQGLTVKNGYLVGDPATEFTAQGGGIKHIGGGGTITVKRCIISDNTIIGYPGNETTNPTGGHGYGGGFYNIDTIINCIVSNNTARGGTGRGFAGGWSGAANPGGQGYGGGGAFSNVAINNTIYNNVAQGGAGGTSNGGPSLQVGGNGGNGFAGGLYSVSNVTNNIFSENGAGGGTKGTGADHDGTGDDGAATCFSTITNNLFYNNTSSAGADHGTTGTNAVLDADPLFINPATNDFRIPGGSPAVNAGIAAPYVPSADFSNYSRTGNPDIGAFETGSPALPVTLVSFTAKKLTAADVLLNWTTATELNNMLFRVERSYGGEAFQRIAQIQGAGNSSVLQNYSLKDSPPKAEGTYYYRLVQVDFNGKEAILPVVSVQLKSLGKLGVAIAPNPVSGPLKVMITNDTNEITHLSVLDIRGRVVYEKDTYAEVVNLNLEEQPRGLYFIKVSSGTETVVQKIALE